MWSLLVALLDDLDASSSASPEALLAVFGFGILSRIGYALELDRCVVCGRDCPPSAAAFVDARRGGVVCRACGGTGQLLDARTRGVAAEAQRGGVAATPELPAAQAKALLVVLADAMTAHANLPSAGR